MQTIGQWIIARELNRVEERLIRMEEQQAPPSLIMALRERVRRYRKGLADIAGDNALLDVPYEYHEPNRGRHGKLFITFNGNINYFPETLKGAYIAKKPSRPPNSTYKKVRRLNALDSQKYLEEHGYTVKKLDKGYAVVEPQTQNILTLADGHKLISFVRQLREKHKTK